MAAPIVLSLPSFASQSSIPSVDPATVLPLEIFSKILFYVFPKLSIEQILLIRSVSRLWQHLLFLLNWNIQISFPAYETSSLKVASKSLLQFSRVSSLEIQCRLAFNSSFASSFASSLRSLKLTHGTTDQDITLALRKLTRLESLYLTGKHGRVHDGDVHAASATALRSLTNLSAFAFSTTQKGCESLLSYFKLTSLGIWHLQSSRSLQKCLASVPNLRRLTLGALREINMLDPLLSLASTLTQLTVCNCMLEGNDMPIVGQLTSLCALSISVERFEDLSPLSNLQRLQRLVLNLDHQPADFGWLKRLSQLCSLKYVLSPNVPDPVCLATSPALRLLSIESAGAKIFKFDNPQTLQRLRLFDILPPSDWVPNAGLYEIYVEARSLDLPPKLWELEARVPLCLIRDLKREVRAIKSSKE